MYLTYLDLLLEKKDHLINKLDSLTDDQKKEIIAYFAKHPNFESKIDWQQKDLKYKDFLDVMQQETKTGKKKAVKASGIKGLKEGKDYIEIPLKSDKAKAYIPLNYEASKLIASDKIGSCTGRWCTAYQKTAEHWNTYSYTNNIVFVYVILPDTKYAMAIHADDIVDMQIFDAEDNTIDPFDFEKVIDEYGFPTESNLETYINKAHAIIQENKPVHELLGLQNYTINEDGTTDVNGNVHIPEKNLKVLPVKFGVVKGNFICNANDLSSFENFPRTIEGSLDISSNKFTSLEGMPRIDKGFDCSSNNITSLAGCQKRIMREFNCSYNNLETLEGSPEYVGGDFLCRGNELKNLVGGPDYVLGNYVCSQNYFDSLKGFPTRGVHGDFIMKNSYGKKFTEDDVKAMGTVHGSIVIS